MSGNPRGRPPANLDLPARCRELVPEAIERLKQLLHGDDNRAAAWAIATIFDRAFGKAPLNIEGDGALTVGLMHLIAAREITAGVAGSRIAEANAEPPVVDLTNAEVLAMLGPALE